MIDSEWFQVEWILVSILVVIIYFGSSIKSYLYDITNRLLGIEIQVSSIEKEVSSDIHSGIKYEIERANIQLEFVRQSIENFSEEIDSKVEDVKDEYFGKALEELSTAAYHLHDISERVDLLRDEVRRLRP